MRLRIAGLMFATLIVAGCGLFGDEEEELEPAELVAIEEIVDVKRIWSAKTGGASEFLRVALRPAGDGARIFAASQDGKVTAFDPETGRQLWRTDLEMDLSAGFTDLHTEVYRDILAGGGFGIEDASPSIELVYNIRNTMETAANGLAHPAIR